jgi:hypothetical protein
MFKMKLYIKIENGQLIDHPILEENLIQAFPNIDVNNLPSNFIEFVRKPRPFIDTYEVYDGFDYELIDGVYTDVHYVREMTDEEKIEKQNKTKSNWIAYGGYNSWVFDEETCTFVPPIPKPDSYKLYYWNEDTVSWAEFQPDATSTS